MPEMKKAPDLRQEGPAPPREATPEPEVGSEETLARRAAGLGQRLEEFAARQRAHEGPAPGGVANASGGYGLAFRFAADLIAGVAVGGFIGWALDRQFGTAPVFLVVFFLLGFAAGVLNVVRAAQKAQTAGGASPPGKSGLPGKPGADARADNGEE